MYEEFLQTIPLFSDLSWDDLTRLCKMVKEVHLSTGQELFAEGSPGDRAYVIQEGAIEVVKTAGGREVLLAVHDTPGIVIGEMALLQQAPRMASVRAKSDTVLLAIHHEQFYHLLDTSPSAARVMLNTVLDRWRNTESLLRQSEKMAQLGTLTAGVAHELNNPAAAVRRGAEQFREALAGYERTHLELGRLDLNQAQQEAVDDLVVQLQDGVLRPLELDVLARSDREYELEIWLEEQGITNSWELAPALVSLDYDSHKLAKLAESFTGKQLPCLINWLVATHNSFSLLHEIGQGAGRISEIVKALKSYSYMDQAPVQSVDVHEGLDNTLVILRSKLKAGITVKRDYASDLPKINAYSSELNQVWTNIIDNAIDALDGHGEITIRTLQDEAEVVVEIEDNGPGIPAGIQPKIFDPFFTTKAPGSGAGLGLNITYKIVVQKHRGDISLASQPGRTVFTVRLPINLDAE